MDTNNNDSIDRNELRRHCNKLLSFVNDNHEDLKNVENQHLIGVMNQAEELYRKIQKSSDSSAMVIDSKIMKQIGSLTRIQASQMSANIYKFSSDIFADRLRKKMNISEEEKMTAKKMTALGKNVKPLVRKSPVLTYLFSALSSEEAPAVKVVKQRKQRAYNGDALKETLTEKIDEKKTSTNDELIVMMFKLLVRKFRENEREPVNFFRLIIDPESFGKSVENLFHVSFLIKDGRVGIRVNTEDEMPEIWPVTDLERSNLQSDGAEEEGLRNQIVMSFNMSNWRCLGQIYNIAFILFNYYVLRGK